jgi:hypothetical protein
MAFFAEQLWPGSGCDTFHGLWEIGLASAFFWHNDCGIGFRTFRQNGEVRAEIIE